MGSESIAEVENYRRGRVPRQVRERQIFAIAEKLFAERGYAATSMEEIARRAGVSRPIVYDLGGSKAELYQRMIHHWTDEMAGVIVAAATAAADLDGAIRDGLVAYFRYAAEHTEIAQVILSGSGDPELGRAVEHIRDNQRKLVIGLFGKQARRTGIIPDPQRLEAAVHAFDGVTEFLTHWWLTANPKLTAETLADLTMDLIGPGLLATITDNT